jgi:RNA-directed DNA polymerase
LESNGATQTFPQARTTDNFEKLLIWTGISSKSYWHLSRSKPTQVGMTKDWLKTQGLVSIRALWMKGHGYA